MSTKLNHLNPRFTAFKKFETYDKSQNVLNKENKRMDDLTIEHYTNHPNYFLTMSQSARVLGNKDYRIVERLIEKGFLKAFSLPGTKR